MIKAKFVLYDDIKKLEMAEVHGDKIINKSRFKLIENEPIIVFAKIKNELYKEYAYIVMSEVSGESVTIHSKLVKFNNEDDKDKVLEISLL